MNLFTKFFSKNGSHETSDQISINPVNDISNDGFKEIFTDDTPPVNEFEIKKVNVLKVFMDQNYFSKGYNDGYDFHSTQSLERGIANIRSEYQHLIDIVTDEYKSEIYSLNMNKIQNEGMPGNIIEQFDLRIDTINETIAKCKREYELASGNRGHIEFPINKYKDGFEKGQQQYYNEKFFAGSTGLFG